MRRRPSLLWLGLPTLAVLIAVTVWPFHASCSVSGPWFGPDLRAEHRVHMLAEMLALSQDDRHGLRNSNRRIWSWSGLALSVGDRLYFLPWERQTDLTRNAARRVVRSMAHRWVNQDGLEQGPVYDFDQSEGMRGLDYWKLHCAAMEVVTTPGIPREGVAREVTPFHKSVVH